MVTTALRHSPASHARHASSASLALTVLLIAWFVLVVVLGDTGALLGAPGKPPLAMALAFLAPVVLFFALIGLSRSWREFLLSIDLRLMVSIQAWRFVGFGFLALYAYRILPGSFAWSAGLGDIAIAVTAPWVLLALIRRPSFAASKAFLVWNALGLLDLVAAWGAGAIDSRTSAVAGQITTDPMARLPLVLISAFFVPIFIMLHVAALLQARRAGTVERTVGQPFRLS